VIGLVIRILVLCSVVFAVVFAITRAMRTRVQSSEATRITDEIKKLRTLLQLGEMDATEYAVIAHRIRKDCKRLGIETPDLPLELPPRRRGSGREQDN
jgi:uncharacterized membrane protein